MGLFPNFTAISSKMADIIRNRAGKNVELSQKMAWIRVTSAVNKGLILETIPLNNSFAASYGNSTKSGKIGVNFANESVFVDTDRAYRPSPTIDGLEVDGGNMGLSRKAKFDITCYTLKQADVLSKYFLEPGYTVLIEFGWNSTDSMKERAELTGNTVSTICEIASYNNYLKLYNKRQDSNGEYEGFMGYITDSSFSNSDGEKYILTVEVTTLGEIPTYLQVHRVNVDGNTDEQPTGNSPYDVSSIEGESNAGHLGKSLFKQMFNKLPPIKQTKEVKSLIEIDYRDSNGQKWSHPGNFINMDEQTRELVVRILESNIGNTSKIPKGTKMLTDESYIRLELAFEILNKFNLNLKPNSACGGCDTYDYRININDTVIRAHKYMFSTDGSKLFIPNRNLPEFGLAKTLSSKTDITTQNVIDIKNLGAYGTTIDACPFPPETEKNSRSVNTYPNLVTGKQQSTVTWNASGNAIYSFPSDAKLETYVDSELKPIQQIAEPGEWGYLRNLYINFNFFTQVINRSNYVAKDVYYEILNGLSSAVNSYWDFELFDVPKPTKSKNSNSTSIFSMNMAVHDMSFTGRVTSTDSDNLNYKKINSTDVPIYAASGIDSPFLSSTISIEMPAAKRNQVLAQRNSSKNTAPGYGVLAYESKPITPEMDVNILTDGQPIDLSTNVFSTYPDPVLQLLNSFKKIKETTTDNTQTKSTATAEEVVKKNLDFFTERATVIPLLVDRNEKVSKWLGKLKKRFDVTKLLIVGAWNDPSLLKRVELKHVEEINSTSQEKNMILNSAIIGIEFNFDIIGLSGLSVGDLFIIKGLPGRFNNAAFQVFTVTHNLSDGFWKTSVTAKQRNIKTE